MDAIPKVSDPEKYERVDFTHSSFVRIESSAQFDIQMQYPLLGMKNAESVCYVRKEVYDMLLKAAKQLPQGYRFRIWDAWRPFALQDELYEVYSQNIIRDFNLENYTQEQRKSIITKFVSEPIEDRMVPPVHTTGGAVDITIIDESGNELEMGTEFDAFTDLTHTVAFENRDNYVIRDNRRMLYHIMTSVGFVNLPSEWWHYDYGDRYWAYYNKKPAMYEGVFRRGELYGEKEQEEEICS